MLNYVGQEEFLYLYQQGYSTKELQEMCGYTCRSTVTKKLNSLGVYTEDGQKKRKQRKEKLEYFKEELARRGHTVGDGTGIGCNFIIDGDIRVDVKGSSYEDLDRGRNYFSLTGRVEVSEGNTEMCNKLSNGKMRKRYEDYCDYIVAIGGRDGDYNVWVIPVNVISKSLQTLTINPKNTKGKYGKYLGKWELLKGNK